MRGVHAPLNHIATAVVIIRVVVAVVVIIVVRVVATVAESEAVPEVAVVESSTISIVESATIVESTRKAVTMETTITEAASHAAVEAAAFHGATPQAATCKAATVKTSTSEATTMATAKTATAHAAAKAATAAAMTAPAAAATSAAARQRHGRRNQADARNCQQRDNRFAQHHHSPSEIRSLPQAHCRWRSFRKTAIDFDESVAQVFASDAKLTLKLENESSAKDVDASCSTDDLLKWHCVSDERDDGGMRLLAPEMPVILQPFRKSEQFGLIVVAPIAVRITRMEQRTALRKA
jgi:hypothetical protein